MVGSNNLRKYRRLDVEADDGIQDSKEQKSQVELSAEPENSISKPLSSSSGRNVLGKRGESEALSMCETLRIDKNSGS